MLALRHVGVDYGDSLYLDLYYSGLFAPVRKTLYDIFHGESAQHRDPVIRLLARKDALIAEFLKSGYGKIPVPCLCLLHAKHVGRDFFKPLDEYRKPRPHGIDVEGSHLHTGSMWTKAFSMALIASIALSTSLDMACESKVERYFATSMCISTCMNGPM